MKLASILFLFALSAVAQQAPILLPERTPVTNTLPWNIVGIQTNITSYANGVSVDSFGADPTGAADSSGAIASAIAACPAFQNVCFKIGGKYRINSQILVQNRSAVAFAMTNVYFDSHVASGLNTFYFVGGGIGVTNPITSGYVRGSTSLVMASTTGLTVGGVVQLNESNNPAMVIGAAYGQSQGPESEFDHNQLFQITAISGNNVTLDHPIYITYTAPYGPGLAQITAPCTNSGMWGSWTLDCANSTTGDGVWVRRAMNCQITGGTVTNCNNTSTGFSLQFAYLCTVNACCGPDGKTQLSSSYGVQVVDSERCLVTDNILKNTGTPILVQIGSCGNVISYNFCPGFWFTSINSMAPGATLHGDIPNMNLFEGNVMVEQGLGDITWANNPTNTCFRSFLMGNPYQTNSPTDDRSCLSMAGTNYGASLVGCVLGLPSDRGTVPGGNHIDYDISGDVGAASLFMYADYSMFTQAITGTNGTTTGMPASYYLTSAPANFGIIPFPSIGPDVNTGNSITNFGNESNPAWYRYTHGTNPPALLVAGNSIKTYGRGTHGRGAH